MRIFARALSAQLGSQLELCRASLSRATLSLSRERGTGVREGGRELSHADTVDYRARSDEEIDNAAVTRGDMYAKRFVCRQMLAFVRPTGSH